MKNLDSELDSAISTALQEAESHDNIVIASQVSNTSSAIREEVKKVYAGGVLSPNEILGICTVLFHAVENKKFYDWEMPTLTGYSADEMKTLAENLRKTINL